MTLYFSPLSCSLAARIVLTEASLPATFVEVCRFTKRVLPADEDYYAIHPLGVVPVLLTEDGDVISENVAVLQYLAERTGQMPATMGERAQLASWFGFIATELHKGTFYPFFDTESDDGARAYALRKAPHRFSVLERRLGDRETVLGGAFSVADAYLVTVLTWARATPIDLSPYEHISAYLERHLKRPSVAASRAAEMPLFVAQNERVG